ncbi:MAG: acyltransferase family protein [Solirubrobacteraceae bacterium]
MDDGIAPQATARSAAETPKGFRLDIQGVRGFALILVLLTHAELPYAHGGFIGLDIFFVLSGFLITGLIVGEIQRTGTLSLLKFYGRRAKRLLPLAGTVLGVVVLGSFLLFSPVRSISVAGDVTASALYFVNWRFMANAVDYFAFEADQISPVQHYWSLSIEEQFYLLWPAMLLIVAAASKRLRVDVRRPMLIVVATIGLASLAYGIDFTGVDPQQAYFSTLGRVWELAVGSVLALTLPAALKMPRWLSAALAAGGLAAFVLVTVQWDGATPYPGWQALVPTLATAAIIIGGTATTASAPIRLLSIAPLQFLGKVSYSWYLWHWPALVFAAAIWGNLGWPERLAITLLVGVPAIATHYAIEERFRRSPGLNRRPRRALALGVACTAVAAVLGVSLSVLQPRIDLATPAEARGAEAAQSATIQRTATKLRPTLEDAEADRGRLWNDDCLVKGKKRSSPDCEYGNPDSDTTVIVFGDSHALQYFPAMLELAKQKDWRLVGLTRASCPIADVFYQPTCKAWLRNTMRRIRREKPDLIVTSNSIDDRFRVRVDGEALSRQRSEPLLEAGYARTLRRLKRTGARVAVIRDQTRAPFVPASCVADNTGNLRKCVFDTDRQFRYAFVGRGARKVRGVKVIDPQPKLCPRGRCPSVIGNVIVYRNTYHLTATYAKTLTGWLGRRLPRPSS